MNSYEWQLRHWFGPATNLRRQSVCGTFVSSALEICELESRREVADADFSPFIDDSYYVAIAAIPPIMDVTMVTMSVVLSELELELLKGPPEGELEIEELLEDDVVEELLEGEAAVLDDDPDRITFASANLPEHIDCVAGSTHSVAVPSTTQIHSEVDEGQSKSVDGFEQCELSQHGPAMPTGWTFA